MRRTRKIIDPTNFLQLPATLLESVRAQRVVLFLGAGASLECKDSSGQRPPTGEGLRDLLTLKFLGRLLPKHDLMSAAELCIDAHSQSIVFEYIKDIFNKFDPSPAHKKIPLFPWRAIATTNYDLLVERAYSSNNQSVQDLIRFVKNSEPIDERLRQVVSGVLYLKLHGCIDHIQDPEIPLILAHEAYARYSDNRFRLFSQLEDMASELPFVFVGYRLADPHIRTLVYNLEKRRHRPRWYIVTPDAEPEEVQSWGNRNVEVIQAKFGEFMDAMDRDVPPIWRVLKFKSEVADLPIRRHYKTNKIESPALRSAFDRDLTYIHADVPHAEQDPKKFYEGYDTGWGCVMRRLDVQRRYIEEVVYRAFMDDGLTQKVQLFVLKGPGGSGKTVALKRIAWEAATQLQNFPILWFEQDGALKTEHIAELHGLTDKRIFVFVDRIAIHQDKVGKLLAGLKRQNVPITLIGAERDSEWNTYCAALDKWNPIEVRVPNLSIGEVENLADLLERHHCLGVLANKPRKDQVEAFMKTAERQLLVALHEATRGRKLEDIVFDEYNDVAPEQARRLYLDIATMHQFGVPVRAGSISRISGINFRDYAERFLKPLENVVITGEDTYTGDNNYRARHSRIANLVFNQACPTDEERADQLGRIIGGLNPAYSVDSHALLEITRGRNLIKTMTTADAGRIVYKEAAKSAPDIGFIDQQWAIFESNHPGGSLAEAEMLAKRARAKDRNSNSIIHTQAEVARKRANVERSPLLKDQFRKQSRERLSEIRPQNSPMAASTRCKLLVDEVGDLLDSVSETSPPADLTFLAEKIKDAERNLRRAAGSHIADADIAETEARFRQIMNQKPERKRALERAWSLGPRGSGVVTRLAGVYADDGDPAKAIRVLEDALEKSPDEKWLHLEMAKHMIRVDPSDARIEPHLNSSYNKGDVAFEAMHYHAQYLLFRGRGREANDLFSKIDSSAPDDFRPAYVPASTIISKLFVRPSGSVVRIDGSYLFIRSSISPDDVFSHSDHSDPRVWEELSIGSEVSFEVRFNRKGALAYGIQRLKRH